MIPLDGLAPPATLRLSWPVWGFDISTKRLSCGILVPAEPGAGERLEVMKRESHGNATMVRPPDMLLAWDTLTLKAHDDDAFRMVLALDLMVGRLRLLEGRYGRPGVIGFEPPFVGRFSPPSLMWMIGVFYCAVGQVFGAGMMVWPIDPMSWKLAATGKGIAHGLPKTASKGEKRKAEKARLQAWARDVCGYTGTIEDEADGIGITVGTAVKVARR